MKGRVVAVLKLVYIVESNRQRSQCRLNGKLMQAKVKPVLGDRVTLAQQPDGTNIITALLPRTNVLFRPRVANVDQLWIVLSLSQPPFKILNLLRYLVLGGLNSIAVYLIFNKSDLRKDNQFFSRQYPFLKQHFKTKIISCYKYRLLNRWRLRWSLKKNQFHILTGVSGAGKSSIINLIFNKNITKTQDVSKKTQQGRQTTRIHKLYTYNKSFLADTPGFSALNLAALQINQLQLSTFFAKLLLKRETCVFRNCLHDKDQKCLIKIYVNQGKIPLFIYQNYLILLKEAFKNDFQK